MLAAILELDSRAGDEVLNCARNEDFSGLGELIDTPVKVYSSGMYVRLGFSVAVTFDVAPPRDVAAGTYWALVKVMYFGRLLYSESVPVRILAAAETRGRRSKGALTRLSRRCPADG